VVALVTNLAINNAMDEKVSAAIIKTIIDDAPIKFKLLNEGFKTTK
jgi:hypothetical protein